MRLRSAAFSASQSRSRFAHSSGTGTLWLYSFRNATPASLGARNIIRARNERSLRAICRSNGSGTVAVLLNVTLAPPVDRLRTWQSIVDARLLNAITPPSSVRERAALRFSAIDLLRKEFREKDIKEQARDKSTGRTKCTLALSA